MSQIGSDGFTGVPGDSLPTYNKAWVSVVGLTGVMVITASGDKTSLSTSSGTAAYYRSDITPPSPDYSVSADITFASLVVNGPAVGVIARAVESASTHYEARYLSSGSGNGSWQVRRLLAGTATTLSTASGSHQAGETKRVKFDLASSDLKLYVNGDPTPVIATSDSSITAAGRAGIRNFNGSSSRYQLGNFSVDTADAAGQTTTVTPAPAAVRVTGLAPTISRTANQAFSPAAAVLKAQGYAPAITRSANQQVAPAPAVLTVRGFAPTVVRTGTQAVIPDAARLLLRGFAPVIIQAANNTPHAYADTAMRASMTTRTVQLAGALNMQTPITRPSFADTTGMRETSANRAAGLGAGATNRIVSFP